MPAASAAFPSRLEERLLVGADFHDEGWIFHRPDGSRLRPDATSYAFVRRSSATASQG